MWKSRGNRFNVVATVEAGGEEEEEEEGEEAEKDADMLISIASCSNDPETRPLHKGRRWFATRIPSS